jgi:hypothetical protein
VEAGQVEDTDAESDGEGDDLGKHGS